MTTTRGLLGSLLCTLCLGAGIGLICAWTLNFSAFTSYSYALVKAGPLPRAAPDISFVDQTGNERQLASLQGRYVLLHAFYGTCSTVCPVVIEQLREVYSDLSAEKRSKLVLLSISVDPVRDTTERLADLWRGEGAFEHWIVARPAAASVDRVTRELGIWVYAKTDGTINHSTDLFLIDPKGRIVRVFAAEADSDRMGRDLGKYL